MAPEAPEKTLRAAICGAGMRSRQVWQRHVAEDPGFELVGVMDPSPDSLEKSVAEGHVDAGRTFADLGEMLEAARPEVLLACPVNSAHAWAIEAGLEAGCHVLVEKPFTTDFADAVRLTELAAARGLLVAVVQNWRTKSAGAALRSAVAEGAIGELGQIFFRYLRDREKPHLPDYLYEEEDPLLHAMAIHHFDLFRYVSGQEIVEVSGQATRPPWSRYKHPSTIQLWMETDAGTAISYVATFSSRNAHIPQESLQVEGSLGTIYNDSQYFEPPLLLSRRDDPEPVDLLAGVEVLDERGQYDLADGEILRNFHAAVVSGAELIAPAADNLGTLATVNAASEALRTGTSVRVETPSKTVA